MKSWKEERLHKPSQEAKALREYADTGDFEVVYKCAYEVFTYATNEIYQKFCDSADSEWDLDTVEYAIQTAVTDAFDDFLSE